MLNFSKGLCWKLTSCERNSNTFLPGCDLLCFFLLWNVPADLTDPIDQRQILLILIDNSLHAGDTYLGTSRDRERLSFLWYLLDKNTLLRLGDHAVSTLGLGHLNCLLVIRVNRVSFVYFSTTNIAGKVIVPPNSHRFKDSASKL